MKDIPVDKLQQILNDFVDSGKECGLQLTIYQGGQLAADLCQVSPIQAELKKSQPIPCSPYFPAAKP